MNRKNRPALFFKTKAGLPPEALQAEIASLEKVATSTEAEFISIGERLQVFHRQASELSAMARETAGRLSGHEMLEVGSGFENISEMVGALSGSRRREQELITGILNEFSAIGVPLEAFEKIVRNLNVLCNYIKIEIARLYLADTSFEKLAQDVRSLGEMISAKVNNLSSQVSSILPALNEHAAGIAGAGTREQTSSENIAEKIGGNLSLLSERNRAAGLAVEKISATWQSLAGHIGKVVQSLQFHDITRQRVEHVCHALAETAGSSNIQTGEPNTSAAVGDFFKYLLGKTRNAFGRTHMAHIFRLQAAQLQHADKDLSIATREMIAALKAIASDAQAISEEIGDMSGASANGISFIDHLEKDLADLTAQAEEAAANKRRTAAAMSELSDTSMGMSVFVREMKVIGIEMQRLALNAGVHAAAIGDKGATLGVLAESIQQLTTDTYPIVAAVNKCLEQVVDAAGNLARMAAEESEDGKSQISALRDNFSATFKILKGFDEEMQKSLPAIRQAGTGLAGDIQALVGRINFHNVLKRQFEHTAGLLQTEAEKMGDSPHNGPDEPHSAAHLESLKSKYTMHRERQTHQELTGTKAPLPQPQPQPEQPPLESNPEDDLGDNVELF